MLMAVGATNDTTFTATATRWCETATILVMQLFVIDAFHRFVYVGLIMDFAGAAEIVDGVIFAIRTDL